MSYIRRSVLFTIQHGAQQPDLATHCLSDTCPTTHPTFTIMGTQDLVSPWRENNGRKVCGVLASFNDPAPPANPCAAKINKEVASSISAEFTASACGMKTPVITSGCPTPPTEASESRGFRTQPVWVADGTGLVGTALISFVVLLVLK